MFENPEIHQICGEVAEWMRGLREDEGTYIIKELCFFFFNSALLKELGTPGDLRTASPVGTWSLWKGVALRADAPQGRSWQEGLSLV